MASCRVLLQAVPGSIRLELVIRHPSDELQEVGPRRVMAPRMNGISLMLVRQIVEQHGGTVEVEHEAGQPGIEIVLPASTSEPLEAEASAIEPEPLASLRHVAGLRVLVVDDDSDAREMCVTALTRYGATVTTAASASEALAILSARELDVLIADITMPGEDGFELLRRIRTSPSPAIARMPAAALTAWSRSEDRRRVVSAGFQIHLTKPIDPLALADAIGSLWNGHRSVRSSRVS